MLYIFVKYYKKIYGSATRKLPIGANLNKIYAKQSKLLIYFVSYLIIVVTFHFVDNIYVSTSATTFPVAGHPAVMVL